MFKANLLRNGPTEAMLLSPFNIARGLPSTHLPLPQLAAANPVCRGRQEKSVNETRERGENESNILFSLTDETAPQQMKDKERGVPYRGYRYTTGI